EITLAGDEGPLDRTTQSAAELVRLSDALDELAEIEPALAELVDLHFFCGFSFGEIAGLRAVSERTVYRDWREARLLLRHALLQRRRPPFGAVSRRSSSPKRRTTSAKRALRRSGSNIGSAS